MKTRILKAAAFALLVVSATSPAWADGGCGTARAATVATSATVAAAGAPVRPQSPFAVEAPIWLSSGCCGLCQSDETACILACPPPGGGGHVLCVSRCYSAYQSCAGRCGGC